MATDKAPGTQSYYLVIANIQQARDRLNQIANVTQVVKNIVTHVTKRSQYIWWSDRISRTAAGALILEIPRDFLKVQTWLKNNVPAKIYDNTSIQPLLPIGEM
jgi:hypothetical protein